MTEESQRNKKLVRKEHLFMIILGGPIHMQITTVLSGLHVYL